MNYVQAFIDRQLGLCNRISYDNILRRLLVKSEDSFCGLQNFNIDSADQDSPIFACRFAESDGYQHMLALAYEDGRVAIQDTSKVQVNTKLDSIQCHNNAVFDLAWMPRHMNFVTVSGDHTASLWDIQSGEPKRSLVFSSHSRSVKTAVFRPSDPSVFATGARDGHILIWDIRASHQPSCVLKPDNSLMNCHSSSAPKTPSSHSKRAKLKGVRATSITGLVFQDDQTLISCGECDGNIKVWDLRKNYSAYKRVPLPKHSISYCGSSTKNGYTNLIIDNAGMRLYASCMDNVIYCFNVSTYNALPEQLYVGHENSTFYIKTSLSPDCRYLVSGSSDKNAYIWNVKYSEPIVKLVGHWAEVTCAAWCQTGDMKIVSCSDDARHKIWRIGNEFVDKEEELELKGRAEIVPRTDITSLSKWGTLDRTPSSLKRKQISTPSSCNSKRPRVHRTSMKTKRCLTDMMNTVKEAEDNSEVKRRRLELPAVLESDSEVILPAGIKRRMDMNQTTPTKKRPDECDLSFLEAPRDWSYISPKAGTSYMTPTKNYEKRPCKKLSPKSPKPKSPNIAEKRTPVKVSPSKVRILSFGTPTENLPNFVIDGVAPHHSLMSPVKQQKQESTNWLMLMRREKKTNSDKVAEKVQPLSSPKENVPQRRNSTSEKTPKNNTKYRTLLKYFTVIKEENVSQF